MGRRDVRGGGPSWSAALAAEHGGQRVLIACGTEPGAGLQIKQAYLSADAGRTWRRVANPPPGGYVGDASAAATGPVYLSGGGWTSNSTVSSRSSSVPARDTSPVPSALTMTRRARLLMFTPEVPSCTGTMDSQQAHFPGRTGTSSFPDGVAPITAKDGG